MDLEVIKKKAIEELEEEEFKQAVEKYKERLRKRNWWRKLFPWRIVIIKKEF